MELLLWRWSTAAQITSAILIAGFFLSLARTTPRAEIRPWVLAWMSNLWALLATVAYWYLQPENTLAVVALRFFYFNFKTLFLVHLVLGAYAFTRPGWSPRPASRVVIPAVGVAAGVAAVVAGSIPAIGVIQQSVVGLVMPVGAVLLIRGRVRGAAVLIFGLLLRGALGLVEAWGYGQQVLGTALADAEGTAFLLATHSSFDTGAEWVIVLGSVLLLYRTIQHDLETMNAELLATQDSILGLVDRDPLTGLGNRRLLKTVLENARQDGAAVLFFDLDDFKRINDVYGHQVGDQKLAQFAEALSTTFRPLDTVIRYAGDEFVVVARGATPEQVLVRIDPLRERLTAESPGSPHLTFSVGHAYLEPGGDPAETLRLADEAMYRGKGRAE
jgi:diguanylate cyclase (GGDEF)-like protein